MKPSAIQKAIRELNLEMDRFEKAVGGPLKAWFSKRHQKRCEEFDLRLIEIRAKCPHRPEGHGTNFCRYCGGDLTGSNPPTL